MNVFLIYAFLFFMGSLFGWGLELVFRHWFSRANPEHRWINPGFCVGPYVPLYGFGLCILYFMASMIERLDITGIAQHVLALVLIAAELTLLEYIAGIFLLKVANVRLWDYSMMWGNVNGLICPLFTLFWTLLGVMYYYLIHPHILEALAWLASNLAFSFFIGVFFGVFSIDVAYSINLVTRIKEFADEKEIVVKYEEFKRITYEKRKEQKDKIRFFMSLPRRERMNEMLEHYITAAVAYAESYQHIPAGTYDTTPMSPTTEQAIIMLSSHFYESRDGSTGGFFADNVQAGQQVWHTVNLLLRLDRDWKV